MHYIPKQAEPATQDVDRPIMVKTLATPEMKKRLHDLALAPIASTCEQFASYLKSELAFGLRKRDEVRRIAETCADDIAKLVGGAA